MPPRAQADARLGAARPQCAVGAGADMHAAAALFCLTEVKCPCLDACACGSLITKHVNRKDRATYLPKSGTGRSHFASLYPQKPAHRQALCRHPQERADLLAVDAGRADRVIREMRALLQGPVGGGRRRWAGPRPASR